MNHATQSPIVAPELRASVAADFCAVDKLLRAAFLTPEIAEAVGTLRKDGLLRHALVALVDGAPVGFVTASPMLVESKSGATMAGRFVGLVPLAVAEAYRGQGIGKALVAALVDACRADGIHAILVLGKPEYYRKLGFTHCPLGNEFGAKKSFSQLELVAGALPKAGFARYAPPLAPEFTRPQR